MVSSTKELLVKSTLVSPVSSSLSLSSSGGKISFILLVEPQMIARRALIPILPLASLRISVACSSSRDLPAFDLNKSMRLLAMSKEQLNLGTE